MNKRLNNIEECYSCGLFIEKDYKTNLVQRCPRCNSKLPVDKELSYDSLYYAISAILLFIILNIYPIITLDIAEKELKTTLIGAVLTLIEQGFLLIGLVVFFTILFAPILNSFIIIFVYLQQKLNLNIVSKPMLYDSFYFFKHWGFIEVFIISIIVTYIKLIGMVSTTKFDIGFYVMLIYILCFYLSNKKFNAKNILGD
ncbi:paraquat-inducible protein A [Aliarcobacter lanthieri]|uniref:paraquat-inducible protein A n=1 Tax=Aliarcobacter lanthieri TaxID=1355374 RepID=UPI0004788DA5|nr:paraquat-inducible protein A [Aliarcobacter lanthieri]QKF59717.1 PqiA family membrane protein [Aliarcobacter lanthieri]